MTWKKKSNLASEKITSKSTKRTGKELKYLIPHCTAGNENSKGIDTATYFCNTTRECSANYCVGADDICCNVYEDRRAWTSGGKLNVKGLTGAKADHSAITFELSSNSSGTVMKQSTIDNFIKLAVDICERYNKTKVLYFEDKETACTYDVKSNEVVILFHSWFANKTCPGPYFISVVKDVVNKINEKLKGECEMGCPYWNGSKCTKDEPQTTSFKLGDEVRLKKGEKYYNGKQPASWVYTSKLYIREWKENSDTCVVSTLKTGAITGRVKKTSIEKY